eukprot:15450-Heterococcus_DN1.PRE.3
MAYTIIAVKCLSCHASAVCSTYTVRTNRKQCMYLVTTCHNGPITTETTPVPTRPPNTATVAPTTLPVSTAYLKTHSYTYILLGIYIYSHVQHHLSFKYQHTNLDVNTETCWSSPLLFIVAVIRCGTDGFTSNIVYN